MDIKLYTTLGTLATQDSMVYDLRQAIATFATNTTAVETLTDELIKVATRRAETFFAVKDNGYKNIQDAVTAYCDEVERKHNLKEE